MKDKVITRLILTRGPVWLINGHGFHPDRNCLHTGIPNYFPITVDDDIEHFLTTFERMAQVCHWPHEEWAVRLVLLLTGKARSAYVPMDIADSKVKDAILVKYEITADT